MTIQEARQQAELAAGRKLDDQTFHEVLEYTRHKAKVTGHSEDYVPLLLFDEVRNHIFREQISAIYCEAKAAAQEIDEMLKRGEWPCVKSVSARPA